MRRSLPSASHLELAEHCVFPWAGGVRWPERPSLGIPGRYGNAFHELAAGLVRGVEPQAAALIETHGLPPAEGRRLIAAGARVAELLDGDLGAAREAEVEIVYHVAGARARRAPRTSMEPGEMFGAADVVLEREDGVVVVRDWKTGERAKGKGPLATPQLRFLARAAADLFPEAAGIRVELAFVDEDGAELVGEDVDALELGAVEYELVDLVERVDAVPAPRPGPWCDRYYCPIRAVCPATVAALAVVDQDLARTPLVGEIATAWQAAAVRHRLPVLQAWLDQRHADLEAWSKKWGPLPVEDKPGVFWGPVDHAGRERIEATRDAVEIVRQRLGEHADLAIERSMSKASLERGTRAALTAGGAPLKRGALSAAVKSLLEELRGVHAVVKGAPYTKFEEFKKATAGPEYSPAPPEEDP